MKLGMTNITIEISFEHVFVACVLANMSGAPPTQATSPEKRSPRPEHCTPT